MRIYRNYSDRDDDPIELVTSWRALNDRIKVKRGSGLVLHWQQDQGLMLAAGDTRNVRVWDAHRELCVQVGNNSRMTQPIRRLIDILLEGIPYSCRE